MVADSLDGYWFLNNENHSDMLHALQLVHLPKDG